MRAQLLVASLVLVIALAGCGGKSSSSSSSSSTTTDGLLTCSNGETTTGACPTTNTTLKPNVPPVLVITTSLAGKLQNFTFIGENFTIEAKGSTDDDGDGLATILVFAQDSNRTYPTLALYSGGEFHAATYKFDRAGPVNITATAVDGRLSATTNTTKVFVDQKSTVAGPDMALVVPTTPPAPQPTSCKGPSGQTTDTPVDAQMSYRGNFVVAAGAKFVEAKVTGTAAIAICDSTGKAISPAGTAVVSAKGTVFIVPAGTASYYVEVYNGTPHAAAGAIKVDVTVHYEPQA